jgi:hypothetical protein
VKLPPGRVASATLKTHGSAFGIYTTWRTEEFEPQRRRDAEKKKGEELLSTDGLVESNKLVLICENLRMCVADSPSFLSASPRLCGSNSLRSTSCVASYGSAAGFAY